MAKTSGKKAEKKELPGVPIERFEAGVRALVELRDRGKFLIFLARRQSVQLIGRESDFSEALSGKLSVAKLDEGDSRGILREIRRFLSIRTQMPNAEHTSQFLTRGVFDDGIENLAESAKTRFREQLAKKIALVEDELYTPSLRTREERFESTTAACLEDLEFELVEERSTTDPDKRFEDPFLRIRLRYSKGTESKRLLRFFGLMEGVSGGNPFGPTELYSFELECDESDIDLMMLRLAAAKQRLLNAREGKTEND